MGQAKHGRPEIKDASQDKHYIATGHFQFNSNSREIVTDFVTGASNTEIILPNLEEGETKSKNKGWKYKIIFKKIW